MFNFAENQKVTDINTVPENFRGVYVEESDGSGNSVFVISDSAKGLVEAYSGTSAALDKARADKKQASDESAARRKALKAVNEFVVELGLEESDDPVETLRSHINSLSEAVKNGKEMKVDLEKIRKEYDARMNELTKAHETALLEKDGALNKHLIQDVATRELAGAKGSVELLLPHIKDSCRVVKTETGEYDVRVVDAQGDVRSDGAGGWLTVKGLVAEMKNDERFGRAFESDVKSGTGSVPGGANRNLPNNQNQNEKTPTDKIASALNRGGNKRVYGAGAPQEA